MRLIDSDHLRKWIIANWGNGWHSKTVDDILDQIDREDTYFKDADIVDAEPIRYGHWEKIETSKAYDCQNTVPIYKCSFCHTPLVSVALKDRYHYCPNCGAKMDEVEE